MVQQPLDQAGGLFAHVWPRRATFRLAALLALAGLGALAIDLAVARWALAGEYPYFCKKICNLAEGFGHGLGVPLIVLAVVVLDPARRWSAPRLLAASLGSGLVANVLKLLIGRWRPAKFEGSGTVWDTFTGWLPLWNGSSSQQGFPSTHTVTAVGLAVALACLYPRGRWYFAALAALVACQRLLSGYHFLSDTLWGASAGILLASACCGGTRLAAWFGRLERRLGGSELPSTAAVPAPGKQSRAA
jgi:membrane-associated phospholipid phosphatase